MTRTDPGRLATIAAPLLLILSAGCNDGSISVSGSTREATVRGTVTILGKPATDVEVVFDPANVNRPDAPARRAKVGPDGAYSLTTLVGENMALVEGPSITKNKLDFANRKAVVVDSGDNVVDLSIPIGSTFAPAPSKGAAPR